MSISACVGSHVRYEAQEEAHSTYISAHVWQLGGVNAANVPVEQFGHWVKGVLSLCHSQVTIQNTLWHRYLQHNTLHLEHKALHQLILHLNTQSFRN